MVGGAFKQPSEEELPFQELEIPWKVGGEPNEAFFGIHYVT